MTITYSLCTSFPNNRYRSPGLRKKVGAMVAEEEKVKIDKFDGKDFNF